MALLPALVIGVVAGLRTFTAPAAVSWAATLGWLQLPGSALAWLGTMPVTLCLTLLALGEFVVDQLPMTPSRTVPPQFAARVITGSFSGAAIGLSHGSTIAGLVAGFLGAVVGTLGGRAARGALANAFGNDHPAATVEDGVAVALSFLALGAFR
jgi:uncharacterized membrane protein